MKILGSVQYQLFDGSWVTFEAVDYNGGGPGIRIDQGASSQTILVDKKMLKDLGEMFTKASETF